MRIRGRGVHSSAVTNRPRGRQEDGRPQAPQRTSRDASALVQWPESAEHADPPPGPRIRNRLSILNVRVQAALCRVASSQPRTARKRPRSARAEAPQLGKVEKAMSCPVVRRGVVRRATPGRSQEGSNGFYGRAQPFTSKGARPSSTPSTVETTATQCPGSRIRRVFPHVRKRSAVPGTVSFTWPTVALVS